MTATPLVCSWLMCVLPVPVPVPVPVPGRESYPYPLSGASDCDEENALICHRKNHFQVTCEVTSNPCLPFYVCKTPHLEGPDGTLRTISKFYLDLHGIMSDNNHIKIPLQQVCLAAHTHRPRQPTPPRATPCPPAPTRANMRQHAPVHASPARTRTPHIATVCASGCCLWRC